MLLVVDYCCFLWFVGLFGGCFDCEAVCWFSLMFAVVFVYSTGFVLFV